MGWYEFPRRSPWRASIVEEPPPSRFRVVRPEPELIEHGLEFNM